MSMRWPLRGRLRHERVDVDALAAEGAPAAGAVARWQRLGLNGWFAEVGARRGAAVLEHAVFAMVRLKDPAKIGRAAQRILGSGGAGRIFDVESGPGRFIYHYDEQALAHEELLAGRYVLTTSLTPTQASTAQVVAAYRQLANTEARRCGRPRRCRCRSRVPG